MPNHIKNVIRIIGGLEDIQDAMTRLGYPNTVDFNRVVRMPNSLRTVESTAIKDFIHLACSKMSGPERERIEAALRRRPHKGWGRWSSYGERFVYELTFPLSATEYVKVENRLKEDMTKNPKYTADLDFFVDGPAAMGKVYIDNILTYGHPTWYDWSIENWGTKWNAYEVRWFNEQVEFETAWSNALPVILKLSEFFPDLKFRYDYADEDIGHNCGWYKIRNGKIALEDHPVGDEAVRFACEMWDYDYDEYIKELEGDEEEDDDLERSNLM